MADLPEPNASALRRLVDGLPDVDWALTGSTSFALQGVPVEPGDVDVQTDESGARAVAARFPDHVRDPVSLRESDRVRSQFGVLDLGGCRVEVMGALRRRQPDGTWGPPVDVTDHRRFVECESRAVPVLSLDYEADAYRELGRTDRARLLDRYG